MASTRAARVHLADTRRDAFMRKGGGVPCTTSLWKMNPVWGRDVAVEYPANVFFFEPNSIILQEGVPANARRPPGK